MGYVHPTSYAEPVCVQVAYWCLAETQSINTTYRACTFSPWMGFEDWFWGTNQFMEARGRASVCHPTSLLHVFLYLVWSTAKNKYPGVKKKKKRSKTLGLNSLYSLNLIESELDWKSPWRKFLSVFLKLYLDFCFSSWLRHTIIYEFPQIDIGQ